MTENLNDTAATLDPERQQKAKEYARRVNHHLEFIELSATSGEGMEAWYEWLRKKRGAVG